MQKGTGWKSHVLSLLVFGCWPCCGQQSWHVDLFFFSMAAFFFLSFGPPIFACVVVLVWCLFLRSEVVVKVFSGGRRYTPKDGDD